MQSRKGEKIDLKNEIFIDQNETWRFQVTTVIGLHIPVVCLLLNLQEIKLPDFPTLQIKIKPSIELHLVSFFMPLNPMKQNTKQLQMSMSITMIML